MTAWIAAFSAEALQRRRRRAASSSTATSVEECAREPSHLRRYAGDTVLDGQEKVAARGCWRGTESANFYWGSCVIELPDVMIFIDKRTALFEVSRSIGNGFAKDGFRSVRRQLFRKLNHARLRPMPKIIATFESSFAK